jgi:hypothetical protein
LDGDSYELRWRAADAVRHIGTNAVPLLVSQLSHRRAGPEPSWRWKIDRLLSRQSLVKVPPWQPSDDRSEALAALDALRPNAKAGLPALEGLLSEKWPDQRALLVLASIGPEAIPALTRALTNEQKMVRFGARSCLDMMQSHSPIVFPRTPAEAEFTGRACQFNITILRAAFEDYKAQHPEELLPKTGEPGRAGLPGQLTQSTNPTADAGLGDIVRYLEGAMGYSSNQLPATSAPSAQPRRNPFE